MLPEPCPAAARDALERAAFLAALRGGAGDPADLAAFADWLEDRGDPRGACLRAEFAARRAGVLVYGVLDVERLLGLTWTDGQLRHLGERAFRRVEWLGARRTHVLVPGSPVPLPDLVARHRSLARLDTTLRVPRPAPPRWHLLRRDAHPGSARRPWDEQQRLVGPTDEPAPAEAVVLAALAHRAATGRRWLAGGYLRTATLSADGRRVEVGAQGCGRLLVVGGRDDLRLPSVGIASQRRPRGETA